MNILLINHYAGSPEMGMEYRPYYLAKEWIKLGHNVTIIAANFHHLRKRNPDCKKNFQEEYIEGIKYVWVKTREYSGNGIKRFGNIYDFVKTVYKGTDKIIKEEKPDVVIASSTYPYDNLIASRICKKTGAKHIYEVHDLWPLSPMELSGYKSWHPFIVLTQYFEDFSYKRADKVVSLLPKAKDYMISRGMSPEKFIWIPNGIYLDEWQDIDKLVLPDEITTKINTLKQEGKRIIGYAGTIGLANAIQELTDAAKLLSDNEKIHFIVVGGGPLKEKFVQNTDSMENITFFSPINKSQIPLLLSHFDICFFGSPRIPLYRFGISPNKLMDYMVAGKPIVSAVEAGNDPVKEADCGVSINAENPKLIAEAINDLIDKNDSELRKIGANGRKYILETADYKVLAKKYVDVISD